MRSGSDIQHQAAAPTAFVAVDGEAVVGHRLDEMRGHVASPLDGGAQCRPVEVERYRSLRDEVLRLGEEDQLLQPGGEERGAVGALGAHLMSRRLSVASPDKLAEGAESVFEEVLFAVDFDHELELCGVLS